MLKIHIPDLEGWDELHECFIYTKAVTLTFEHSLVSISKWESKWKKPYVSEAPKTDEELIDYFRCMTITQNVDPMVYVLMPESAKRKLIDYIGDSHTATNFYSMPKTTDSAPKSKGRKGHANKKNVVTSELIYYWMIAYEIPFECQRWHLNRLMALINICRIKSQTDNKMSKKDTYANYAKLNEMRRKKAHSKG